MKKVSPGNLAKIAAALLLLSLPIGVAFAQDAAPFTPAALGEGEYSLLSRLRTPIERPSGNYDVVLKCQVIVEPDGSTRSPRCLAIERYATFRFETERALTIAIMTPARIVGEPVRVLMNLLVGYRCEETCPAIVATNHGGNLEEFGFSYSAPQPVLDGDRWYQGFDDKLAWAAGNRESVEIGGIRFVISADIDEAGRISQTRVDAEYPDSSGRDYAAIAQSAADSLQDVRYIPAFSKGEPVEMRFDEYWLDPDGTPLDVLTLPVRVHVLRSDLVPALDSTLTDEQVREMFAVANELWQPAAIQWNIESIVRSQAERQLAFRRAVVDDPTGSGLGNEENLSEVCPNQDLLEQGWNVCWVLAMPRGALYFYPLGTVILGEQEILGGVVPPFALGPCSRPFNGPPGRTAVRADVHAVVRGRRSRQPLWQPNADGMERRPDQTGTGPSDPWDAVSQSACSAWASVLERRRSLKGIMRSSAAALALVVMPFAAAAHHSHAEFSAEQHELDGELASVIWRNPHPAITLRVTNGDGQAEIWRIQVQGNVNGLNRDGVSADQFLLGERVRIAGHLSTRRPALLLATHALLADGTEVILGPDESSGSAVYRRGAQGVDTQATNQQRGIFRVWTVASRIRTQDLPLQEAARAAKAAWDPLVDDPQRGCRPLGMPGAMMSPHPIEFLRDGDDIIVHLEEWGAVRAIQLVSDGNPGNQVPSLMGHSVGHWEGDTLVVTTTHIDYPYLDEHGTPQSDAVEVVERFTLSANERSLTWAATVTDPGTLTEPVIAFTTRWVWVPGEEIQPYDCAELDPL